MSGFVVVRIALLIYFSIETAFSGAKYIYIALSEGLVGETVWLLVFGGVIIALSIWCLLSILVAKRSRKVVWWWLGILLGFVFAVVYFDITLQHYVSVEVFSSLYVGLVLLIIVANLNVFAERKKWGQTQIN